MAKLPKLEHVKYVRSKGKVYAYFNTGKKSQSGAPVYARLPDPSDPKFFDSYASLIGGRNRRAAQGYTIAQLVRDFEASMEKVNDLAPNTQTLYRITNKKVVQHLGDFPVNDLEPEDVQFVLDHKIPSAGSHNIFISTMNALYRWARKRGKTKVEPTKDIERVKGGSYEPWPEDILDAGLLCKDDLTRLSISLLFYTGQRIGDVLSLRWSDIKDGRVTLTQEKTGKALDFPMHSALRGELDRTPKRGVTILADDSGKAMPVAVVRKRMKDFTRNQGKECVPHGLRKNAVNALLEEGCTVAEVSSITGQSYKMVELYARKVNNKKLSASAILKFENKKGVGKQIGKPNSETA